MIRAILFNAKGTDRVLSPDALRDARSRTDDELLWLDITGADPPVLQDLGTRLGVPADAFAGLSDGGTQPRLRNCGNFFSLRVVAVGHTAGLAYTGVVLDIIAGDNMVIASHAGPIDFLETIRAREAGDTALGRLSAASFTASLLDWHLSTYFDAVATFEVAVERLEIELLAERQRDCLAELRHLRKGASRLRRMLAPHRVVFAGLSRPDFRPQEDGTANGHFLAIDERFERAMASVENARDLVVGSFELFSSRNTLSTNAQMRVLTFVTVVIGVLAVLAGVLGMNFDAPFFKAASAGFWTAVAAMVAIAAGSFLLARWRRWL